MRPTVIALCLLASPWTASIAQGPPPPPAYRSGWGDVAAVTASAAAFLLPGRLKLPSGPPSCAPCSPAGLPGIDRWVVGTNSPLARHGSTALLLGVGGMATYMAAHDRSSTQGWGNFAVLANSSSWTAASTQWLKVLVGRKRPVLYTSSAVAGATSKDRQRSFPSGHVSIAFAIATSYLVMANREQLPHRTRDGILLYGGAAGVGALRVASGSHFPTDVLGGAVLGTAIGWLVAAVHPKTP